MDEQAPPRLRPLTETWERALAVVAHPDDMEFGAAAAVAHWTAQGKKVAYCMVTSGEAGIDGMDPPEAAAVREAEQVTSARIVGVDAVDFLRLPDGVIEYGVALRREICRAVRRHRPEIVVTNNFRDTWDGARMLNMSDHIATGRGTLDAVRDAGNRWVFHEQISEEGLQPWDGVRQVWAAGSPSAEHGVDVTDSFPAGVESLKAHEAYLGGLGWHFDPDEFLEGICRSAGSRMGVTFGASFEVFHLAFGGDEE